MVDKLCPSVRKGLSPFGDIVRMEYYVTSKTHIFSAYFEAYGNIHDVMLNESSRRPIYICTMNSNIVALYCISSDGSDFKMHH